ncbi:hypothetical protein OPQ81_004765 [Rhizoctonia solani]|nr:hypothetical protein OPQ81_004765 [Rhizoctonia solani]
MIPPLSSVNAIKGSGLSSYRNTSMTSTFRSGGSTKRGKTLGVQSWNACTGQFVEGGNVPITEEPVSMTDTSGETTQRYAQTSIEALALPRLTFNAAQALALSQPTPAVAETLKPNNFSQPGPGIKSELEENGDVNELLCKGPTKETQPQGIHTHSKMPKYKLSQKTHSLLRAGTDPAPLSWSPPSKVPIARPHPLRTSSTHGQNEAAFHHTSGSPLLVSLFTGSRKPPTLFMLAIAVSYNGLKDPQHDFDLLQEWLKDESRSIRFQGISGEEATREMIEDAICKLYRQALQVPGSSLLILLTGEGDYTNRMHLMKGKFITDSDLRIWLWKLRNESKPMGVPTTIILDYCRLNKHIPLGVVQEGVEFIWTCSLGQTAAALRLPSTRDIPQSCFLLALMLSSYNYTPIKMDLSAAVDYEGLMSALSPPNGMWNATTLPPQKPDWQQTGYMQPVHDLAYVLSTIGSNIVPKVYRVLMNNRWFREANRLPINWVTTTKRDPSNPCSTVRYKRGTCQPAYSQRVLPDQALK